VANLVPTSAIDGQLADLLASYGAVLFYLAVWGLVFVGTALFVGLINPFLTGDSLLFAAGIIAGTVQDRV
jgi:membrane-associated protein